MELRKLGTMAEIKGGKRLPKGHDVQDEPSSHAYLRIVDFGETGVTPETVKYISSATHEKIARYTITESDVYVSIAGTIGRVGIVPPELSGANLTENAAKITQINSDLDKHYLLCFLRSGLGQTELRNRTGGTSQPKLALFRIADVPIPWIPVVHQKRIASIIKEFDDLIENNRRRIQLLEQSARLLYREWFVRLRFPGHEHVRIVDGVPEGWLNSTMAEIAETIGGGTPSTSMTSYWEGGTVTWFTPSDLTANDCLALIDSEKKITEEGSSTVPRNCFLRKRSS